MRKFLSFYLSTLVLLVFADVVSSIVYMAFYFPPGAYNSLGIAAPLDLAIALLEQLALLFFLDSLAMFLSLLLRSSTTSLLVFFAVTILGVGLYEVGIPPWAQYLQLGWGDYMIVNKLSAYIFTALYQPNNTLMLSANAPDIRFTVGLTYRLLGGFVLFLFSLLRFNTMDLE